MHRMFFSCALALACAAPAFAQDAPVTPSHGIHDIEAVVVRGVQPGPGLWKVSRGDHVLWILGTLSPLPKHITWDSGRVEAVIATAQEIVDPPKAQLKSNASVFANLAALPLLIGVRNNPDGKQLRDVVSAASYARWLPLKQKYIGSGNKVESWRPMFAALALYDAAIDKAGLTNRLIAQKAVEAAARHSGVKITTPKVAITVDSPRAAVKEFKSSALADADCFGKTLDRIDTDLATMTARANAWSIGNLDALRKLSYEDQMAACQAALSESGLTQTHGLQGINARAHQVWLNVATSALERNKVTFAVLPIARLLKPEPYLLRLRAMGYAVEEPASKAQPASETQSVGSASN